MDPVSIVVGAIATGAAVGVGDVTRQGIVDLYEGIKARIAARFGSAAADLAAVEAEPEEPLRRQLLAKTLDKAGAGEDAELVADAHELLRQVVELAPEAAMSVGIELRRVETGGDIEVSDIDLQGTGGVSATDVSAGGSLRISGVKVRQEPPHPTQARR
ncbi:hypothetical protein APR11_004765 [Nocardia amikacinitolerans]|uniref:hypothetical protein n=1 Tax=Nocardia amikacinitolerans TaxID=756689 RepID=UPI0020A57817|nr:hypothetical protein [Nocardia amikacinitolerans]MCP2298320.1 hypothetical protein [Nocardia amikacinitolerans]